MTTISMDCEYLSSTARPKYPYPGLRPFEAEEWSIFFGRERMIDEVIDRLADNRLVLIHGSSGSGKSSLVRAGVLPNLARLHVNVGLPWQTCSMRPLGGPLWNLAKELARLEGTAEDFQRVGQIAGQFSRREVTISEIVDSLNVPKGQKYCVLVDQFEELFRFEKEDNREEAELFVNLLVHSAVEVAQSNVNEPDASAVHVVITMRSEYLGECARFKGFAEAVNRTQYLVPLIEREDLLRAIRRPAELYGGEVSTDLAERLVAELAGREDELPLIQHGLMFLWNIAVQKASPGDKIVLDAAPLKAAGGLAKLLSDHADAIVDKVAPDQVRRYATERLFQALTDYNIEGNAIRRPRPFGDLVAVTEIGNDNLQEIINGLRGDGVSFLSPYPPFPIAENTPIDISHEALIRCWDQLSNPQNGWLKREFDDGLTWRSLLVEAKDFAEDRRRILSPATTKERERWWRQRKLNETWAKRYGGNFGLVEKLIAASRRSASQKRLLLYSFLIALFLINLAGITYKIAQNRTSLSLMADIYLRHTVLSSDALRKLKPLDTFKECSRCPQMVVLPGGPFMMGSPLQEKDRPKDEFPPHQVVISKSFAISKFEVTFDEWIACFEDGGCKLFPDDHDWGRGDQPVINVSWDDAQKYVAWLSRLTGNQYRLPSESEWEFAERANTSTTYYWGPKFLPKRANCETCGNKWDDTQPAPVGLFAPNDFGLYDMAGNVSEWVEDCYHPDYTNAPKDESVWLGNDKCLRVSRGGSWFFDTSYLRSAARLKLAHGDRYAYVGFRVARTLAP